MLYHRRSHISNFCPMISLIRNTFRVLSYSLKGSTKNTSEHWKNPRIKHSFALAEVCVALIIIGISTSYVFSSLNQTIQRYSTLRQMIVCHELADENLGRLIATFLTYPPEFNITVEGGESSAIERTYEIHMKTKANDPSKEENESEKETKKKASLITITVTAHPIGNDQISVSRSTNLCVLKEGA